VGSRFLLPSVMAFPDHVGYLWLVGDRMRFRWSSEPIDDAIASVTHAPNVKGWELKGQPMVMKVGVNVEKELFVGFSNFFRFARKKGLTVTLLKPTVKIVLFYSDDQPVTFVEVGKGFDIGAVCCAGFVNPETEKLDDLRAMTTVTSGILYSAVFEAKGENVNISDLPSQSGLPAPVPLKDEPDEAHSESDEEHYISHFDSCKDIANETHQGCYLVLERADSAITVARKWSVSERPEGAVAFFEPSLSKVAPTSWKYNNGGRRVVLLSGAMSGTGPPAKYYDSWINYLSEARKMGGKVTFLPFEDPILKPQVIFQKPDDPTLFHAKIGEPIEMSEQAVVVIVAEDEKTFDCPDMVGGIFMNEGRKLGSILSWVG